MAHHDDPLDDFERTELTFEGRSKTVYRAGSGPAVIVMPEMPGISPDVARFARWVRDDGFAVFMPSLFGRDGAYPTIELGQDVMRRACVDAEFRAFAGGGTSPISTWLRALARHAHAECGGPGVGAVGMCFTGNFALTAALEPPVIAPVLSQPSLPLDDEAALELSDADAQVLQERFEREDLTALGYRFTDDRWCTGRRWAAYRALLGDRFDGREIPASCANPNPPPFFATLVGCPHSVVTAHLVDEAGHPTIQARDAILGFLRSRLSYEAVQA